jgi:hypothetical protein
VYVSVSSVKSSASRLSVLVVKKTPLLVVVSSMYFLGRPFASWDKTWVNEYGWGGMGRRAHVFSEAETVPVCRVVLEMEFLVEFDVEVSADVAVFFVEAVADLEHTYQCK